MLADTAQELLELLRAEVKDNKFYSVSDDQLCLWSDVEILSYMTEAVDALATATNGLRETVVLPYLADATYVRLPPRVLNIYRARLVTADEKLDIVNENEGFRPAADTGRPSEVIRDADASRLRLYPTPTTADSVELLCSVTLSSRLEASDDVPFVKATDQRLLLEYMKWKAYSKQDAETEDLVRAKQARDNWEVGAGLREVELRNHRRSPGHVRMDW
jgi:hypothetical protein